MRETGWEEGGDKEECTVLVEQLKVATERGEIRENQTLGIECRVKRSSRELPVRK